MIKKVEKIHAPNNRPELDHEAMVNEFLNISSPLVLTKREFIEVCRNTRGEGLCSLKADLSCLELETIHTHNYPHRCELRVKAMCACGAKIVRDQADMLVRAGVL